MGKPKCVYCEGENIIPLNSKTGEYICIDCGEVITLELINERDYLDENNDKQSQPVKRH